MTKSGLVIINTSSIPTFQTINGSSYIDLTLVSTDIKDEIVGWNISNELITSDHNAIYSQIAPPVTHKNK